MQYTLLDLLSADHILLDVEAGTAQTAIRRLTESLVATGNVSAEFADDVWQREQAMPTGLPTQPFAIAIPHADPDHVNRSAVGIGVLRSPVAFSQMGMDSSAVLQVRIVFLLAIKEREKQVDMIQQLVSLIQDPQLLGDLLVVKDAAGALSRIRSILLVN
jgi:PTS system galactitol-specific IIA component